MKSVDDKKSRDMQDKWWRQGIMMFAESTGWIAVPVVAALFIGNWLDEKYQTKPLYFLGLTIMAFVISCIGIGMIGIKYIKQIDKENKKDKEEKDNVDDNRGDRQQ